MLWIIISATSVKTSMYQMRFNDRSEMICVYLYDSMASRRIEVLEVKLTMVLELSFCHFNSSMKKVDHPSTNNVLIISLSNDCSLLQQLIVLKTIGWNEMYHAIIFSGIKYSSLFGEFVLSHFFLSQSWFCHIRTSIIIIPAWSDKYFDW